MEEVAHPAGWSSLFLSKVSFIKLHAYIAAPGKTKRMSRQVLQLEE